MSPTSTLLTIAVLHMAAMASPGPNVLLVTQTAMAHSRRRGLAVAAGVATGALLLATGAALGLGLLIGQVGWLRVTVQLAGGAYLIFIGVQTWRGATEPPPSPGSAAVEGGLLRDYRRGVLTNLTNPKAALLFLTLLPQFLPSSSSTGGLPVALALATIPATCSFTGLSLYALGLGRLRPLLRRPRVRRVQERVVGAVLIGLGARLAAERA